MSDQQFYLVTFRKPLPRIMKDGTANEIASAIGESPENIEQNKKLGDHFVPIRAAVLVLVSNDASRAGAYVEVAYSYIGFISVHRDQIAAVTYTGVPRSHLPGL